jgi:hypothetical protein
MAEKLGMEAYLRSLKPTDGKYTLPENKFTTLLSNYASMKNELAKCAEKEREYKILKENEKHVQSQLFKIIELNQELERVRQENARLESQTREATSIAQNAVIELQSARKKCVNREEFDKINSLLTITGEELSSSRSKLEALRIEHAKCKKQ